MLQLYRRVEGAVSTAWALASFGDHIGIDSEPSRLSPQVLFAVHEDDLQSNPKAVPLGSRNTALDRLMFCRSFVHILAFDR